MRTKTRRIRTNRRSRNRVARIDSAETSRKRSVRSTRNGDRNRKHSRKRQVSGTTVIGGLILLVLAIMIFSALRYLFLYVTESHLSADDRYPVEGVDVSTYQLEIDWKGLQSEGVDFAFIKATEGTTHVDDRFAYNWEEANRTDLKVGAYHFLSYDTAGETQAENYINIVEKKRSSLPPVVDVEFYGKYIDKHPSREKLQTTLNIVLEKLEQHYKKKPIIYTNTYIYNTYISGEYDQYDIWISNPDLPEKLPDEREWTFCQYTFKGKSQYVANGKKYVDRNVFNGTKWEFRKYDGK